MKSAALPLNSVPSCLNISQETDRQNTTIPPHSSNMYNPFPIHRPARNIHTPTHPIALSPVHSGTSQTASKHSLVILTPSSTTTLGSAKLCPPSPFPTNTLPSSPFFFVNFPLLLVLVFVVTPFAFPFPNNPEPGCVCVCELVAVLDVEFEVDVDWDSDWSFWCRAEASVSSFISCSTRDIRSGNVVHVPERRRVRAWFCRRVGQFCGWEWRAWRRVSWILFGGEGELVFLFLFFYFLWM